MKALSNKRMNYIDRDNSGRIESCFNVFGEQKLQDENMTELRLIFTAMRRQMKLTQNKITSVEINCEDFKNEIILVGNKEIKEANISVNESAEVVSKAFDVSFKNSQLVHKFS